jgi:quinol-cytochrome oxidoreductase complex cytochrome b subunit
VLSVMFLFVFSISSTNLVFSGMHFSPISRFLFWRFVSNFFLLTWLGSCPAETPYTEVALFCTVLYFILISALAIWSHAVTYLYLRSSHRSVLSVVGTTNL